MIDYVQVKQLEDGMKKLMGLPPYDRHTNQCWHDRWYARFLQNKYGEGPFRRMWEKLDKERIVWERIDV